jgi:hypothetical protein
VSLWNYSDVQLTFSVYATDAFNNATGEFSLLPKATPPKDVGTWVTLGASSVTAPPHTRVDIPVHVHVPANASPGDHTAGIVASLPTTVQTPDSHQTVTVERRTGSRLYVRVNGPVHQALVVENMSSDYKSAINPLDGTFDVSYTVRNAGNVRLGARQRIEVTDVFGRTLATRDAKELTDLLPGNTAQIHEEFTGIPAALRVGATVRVTPVEPEGVSTVAPPPSTYTSHDWAIPWSVLAALLLAFVLWRVYRRFRDRHAAPPAAPPDGQGGGPSGGTGRGPSTAPLRPEPVLRFRGRPAGDARA